MNAELSEKAKLDLVLVEKAQKGDQQAFSDLLNRYKDAIYYMLLKMVSNPSDAEDLTIEAFGKAFRNIDQYAPNYAFSTWLFKIASNNCIDFIRKKRSSPASIDQVTDSTEDVTTSIQSGGLDPEENLIKDQKNKLLHSIVLQLKPRYRVLIELRYFKEYSYEEIAKELDLPIGTVKAQLFRARELLQQILKKTGQSI